VPTLWKDKERDAFYLIEEGAPLPAGELELQDLRKREWSVDPTAAARFRIPEDEARERAVAEMARIRDAVKAGTRRFRDVAAGIHERIAAYEATTHPDALAGAHRPPDPDPGALREAMKPHVDALGQALDALLTEDGHTEEGRARLLRIAEAVRDGGGPDWTDDPAAIPARLREALSDPSLAQRLAGLWRDVRDGAPVPGSAAAAGDDEGPDPGAASHDDEDPGSGAAG
jgi:hypothetical protein